MPTLENALRGADYAMLAGYFVLMLGIGFHFYRQMKGMKDYFTGNNMIPWWLSGVSFYMTSFSVAAFVFYPSVCYRQGWVGVTLLWVAIPATLFSVLLFAKRWRRARIDSPVEYIETRYSPLLRQLFAWQGVPFKMIENGIRLFATSKFISICAGIPIAQSIIWAGGIMLAYTFLGGLWAVAVTDFIQFVVLTVGILVILPLSISKAGGLGAIMSHTPDGFFSMTSKEFGWEYILPLIVLYCFAWSSINWSLVQRYYCVPKEKDAMKVGWSVIALYILGPPIMFFPAIAATQFLPNLEDAGDVYPMLCKTLLPAGMLGLAMAAMFSATMSTLSAEFNVSANILTNDVYRRLFRPNATEGELLRVGRVMTLIVGSVCICVAVLMSNINKAEDLFRIMVTLFGIATAPVAVPMMLGLLSRKMTNAGAIAGFVTGLTTGLLLFAFEKGMGSFQAGFLAWDKAGDTFIVSGLKIQMEIVMFMSTAFITAAVMACVSAIAPLDSEARARVDAFLKRLDTPIGDMPGEEHLDARTTGAMSPFRVVGVCIAAIGVMMIAVIPWMGDNAEAIKVDILLACILIVMGGLMALKSRNGG